MARTNSKAKKASKREKSINKVRLPQQLTQLPALKFIPLPCMSNLGKVKLWLPSTPCNRSDKHPWPQLVLLNSTDEYHYYDIHICNPYGLRDDQQQPTGSHWRVVKVEKPVINYRFSYPCWHWDGPLKYASRAVSHHGYTPNAMDVMLTYDSSPALMVYCFNERDQRAWIRHECNVIDPFDAKRQRMQFTRIIIGNDDKIYALSLQGALAVMEDVDSRLVITTVSSTRSVPSVSSKYFKEYFVKLNGDILLIFLICRRSPEVVDDVEVSRLCFDKLKWIKVERLDGKALFLDQCGIWANSEEVGCKKNCVYFTQGANNGWWEYDIERSCISPSTHVDKLRRDQ